MTESPLFNEFVKEARFLRQMRRKLFGGVAALFAVTFIYPVCLRKFAPELWSDESLGYVWKFVIIAIGLILVVEGTRYLRAAYRNELRRMELWREFEQDFRAWCREFHRGGIND